MFDKLKNIFKNKRKTINWGFNEIKACAYSANKELHFIRIPKGIKTIGERAFQQCENLIDVQIADTVTSIEEAAFAWCYNLKNINLPTNITEIKAGTFQDCTSLQNINIPQKVALIERAAFSHCKSLERIILPNSLTSVEPYAFSNCTALKSITIPATIINEDLPKVFDNCKNIQELNIIFPHTKRNFSFPSPIKDIIIVDNTLVVKTSENQYQKLDSNGIENVAATDPKVNEAINQKNMEEVFLGVLRTSHIDKNGNNVYFEPVDKTSYVSDSIRGGDYYGLVKISGKIFKKPVVGVALEAKFGSFVRIYSDEPIEIVGSQEKSHYIEMPLYKEDSNETILGSYIMPDFVKSGNYQQIIDGIASLKTQIRVNGMSANLDMKPTQRKNDLSLMGELMKKPDIPIMEDLFTEGENSETIEQGIFIVDNYEYRVTSNGAIYTIDSNRKDFKPAQFDNIKLRKMRNGQFRLEFLSEKGIATLGDSTMNKIVYCKLKNGKAIIELNLKETHEMLEIHHQEQAEAYYDDLHDDMPRLKSAPPITPIFIYNEDIAKNFFSQKSDINHNEAMKVLMRVNEFLLDYNGIDQQILCSYIEKSYEYDLTKSVHLNANERVAFTLAIEFTHTMYFKGIKNYDEIINAYRNNGIPSDVSMPEASFVEDAIKNTITVLEENNKKTK